MTRIVFLDTNVYLHCQMFDQIDWPKLLNAAGVKIVIPPVTLFELNRRKDLPSRPRVRKRAAKVLRRLSALLESGPEALLRAGVDVLFEDREPSIDFSKYQLVREVQDDNLIASIIMYRGENPEADILLLTSDTGLGLVAKAVRQGIATMTVPESLRLPREPDPDEQRMRELERQLDELRRTVPELSLAFKNGGDHATFVLPRPLALTQEELDGKLELVRQQYPRMQEEPEPLRDMSELMLSVAKSAEFRLAMDRPSVDDIRRYHAELDEFYDAHVDYFHRELSYQNLLRRTIIPDIVLANNGSAPAEDVDVLICFPDGLQIAAASDYPEHPQAPEPPPKPRSPMQQLLDSTRSVWGTMPISPLHQVPPLLDLREVSPPNVSAPSIRRTNSYEVEFHVGRIKHKTQEPCLAIHVVFDTFETARSFHADYRILAANVPTEITGQLHVVIEHKE